MTELIYLRIAPKNIDYLNRIFEGYEYIGVVTTIKRDEGIVVIRVTPDTYREALLILDNLDVDFKYEQHTVAY